MAATTRMNARHPRYFSTHVNVAARAMRVMRERIPLHASATSRLVLARVMTFPLAQDGYPEDLERVLRRAGGKALERESDGVEDDLGGGIMNRSIASGTARTRR
jgi:hypothetical protein